MKIFDLVCAWTMVVLGVVRSVSAALPTVSVDFRIPWSSAGIALIATGMLNVLRVRTGSTARAFAIICNILLAILIGGSVLKGFPGFSQSPEFWATLVVVGLETIFSIVRSK